MLLFLWVLTLYCSLKWSANVEHKARKDDTSSYFFDTRSFCSWFCPFEGMFDQGYSLLKVNQCKPFQPTNAATNPASVTWGSSLCHLRLQPLSPEAPASVTWGSSLCHLTLQPLSPDAPASITGNSHGHWSHPHKVLIMPIILFYSPVLSHATFPFSSTPHPKAIKWTLQL